MTILLLVPLCAHKIPNAPQTLYSVHLGDSVESWDEETCIWLKGWHDMSLRSDTCLILNNGITPLRKQHQ